jgi:hypothetical protein
MLTNTSYQIPSDQIKQVKFSGDGRHYDFELYKLGKNRAKFIVVNPDPQISFDWENEFQYYVPNVPLPIGACLVISYQGEWYAKVFSKNWDSRQTYLSFEIQIPKKRIERVKWEKNEAFRDNFTLLNDPRENFNLNVWDKDYDLVWYIDPKFTGDKKIWAFSCKAVSNKNSLGIKDMGYVTPVINRNPDLGNINFEIKDYPVYYDLNYNFIWYIDTEFTNNKKIWIYKLENKNSNLDKEMGYLTPNLPDILDVIFISYNEPEAEKNWQRVLEKAPWAKRIDGVQGIANAHKLAAEISDTDMLYVVDGDAYLTDDWNFNFQPGIFDRSFTHIWHSKNPVNDLEYGYGGVKLFSKDKILSLKEWTTVDFTSQVSDKIKVIEKVSNVTKFDTDPFSVWRSSVRECVKLYRHSKLYPKDTIVKERLAKWRKNDKDHVFKSYSRSGAEFAINLLDSPEENIEKKVNDFNWLREQFEKNQKRDTLNIKGDETVVVENKIESKYYFDSNVIIDKLNEVSPSFCLAKWFNTSIHIPTGQTHSCYHPPSHKIPLEEIKIDVSSLHNTKYKKQQRKKMLDGVRPDECNFCWQIEDSGNQLSDRAYRSKDVWEFGIVDEALKSKDEGNVNPRYLEVNFNQACNFKCSYCSPHLSTEWMKDIEKNGPFQLGNRLHNDLNWMKEHDVWPNNSLDNPYLLAFWEWWPTIYSNLKTFRMTGGEPLMDKNTFRIFDYIKQNPKPDLHLSITSNCCPPGNQWNKFINSLNDITESNNIDHFMLYCSLDSWGSQAEYIRTGLDFSILLRNVREFLVSGNDKHSLTFICTFNALSYSGFLEYMKNILELRKEFNTTRQLIWFDIPQLQNPEWLNPKLIPELVSSLEETKQFMSANAETIKNQFKGFKDFEISKVQRLIDWIKDDAKFDRQSAMKNFYSFWKENDKRNKTDFLMVFPELENFWNECRKQHGRT